jgi:hypothetical protein
VSLAAEITQTAVEAVMRARNLVEGIEVEPLTAIPAAFPEQRARVLRILIKWQRSFVPAGVTPAYPASRVSFHERHRSGARSA